MKHWISWAVLAAVTVILGTGCGGGEEEAAAPDFGQAFGVTPPEQPVQDQKAAETYTSQYQANPVQQKASQALVLEQQEDWVGAIAAFDQLQTMDGVTSDQWMAARAKKHELQRRLIELQAQGKSAEAEAVLRQLRRR